MITDDDLFKLTKGKLDYNAQIIMSTIDKMEAEIKELKTATQIQSMDKMNLHLKAIVDSSVGCRSRLQFMRGVWSYYKDLKPRVSRTFDEGLA
jgi:hypothetical protein